MRLFDTHCHLNDRKAFPNPSTALDEARRAGVVGFLVVGYDLATSRSAVGLAERHADVWAAVGMHPTSCGDWNAQAAEELVRLARHDKVAAWGEIGLDYYWKNVTPEVQSRALLDQLELAKGEGLPVVFHCRDAYDDLLHTVENLTPERFVLHCFSGDERHLSRASEMGAYLGVDGPVTYPKSTELRRYVARMPLDRILIETDAPWLAPQAHRGKPNRPAYLTHVNLAVAESVGLEVEACAHLTTSNAIRFLGLDPYGPLLRP